MVTFNPQIPIGQTFQALLNQATGLPYGDGQRVPFEFSSTLRDASVNLVGPLAPEVIDARQESFNSFAPGTKKEPIRTLVNPNTVSFDQPKRFTRKDFRNGTAFFHFTDDRGQNNDILQLELKGSTGNIDLRADQFPQPATQDVAARKKLEIFQQLYLLTREPMLFKPGIINEFTIDMRLKSFPGGIRFFGFYSKVMSFEHSASKPNSVDYSLSFTVQRTFPDLNDIVRVTQEVLSEQTFPDPTPDSTLFPTDG